MSLSAEEIYRRRVAAAKRLNELFSDKESLPSLCALVYGDLLEEALLDVAIETQREAQTQHYDLSAAAASLPSTSQQMNNPVSDPHPGGKALVDVYGQTHPSVANDPITCANCGRALQAGRYAPHLEKCFGKGRAASRGAARRIAGMQGFLVDR